MNDSALISTLQSPAVDTASAMSFQLNNAAHEQMMRCVVLAAVLAKTQTRFAMTRCCRLPRPLEYPSVVYYVYGALLGCSSKDFMLHVCTNLFTLSLEYIGLEVDFVLLCHRV
eukprot:556872-Amphidinium_carterae.2